MHFTRSSFPLHWLTGGRAGSLCVLAAAAVAALVGAAVAAPAAKTAPAPTEAQAAFFEAKIRPLLVERCFSCHGPKNQSGGLRLDSRAALIKGGASGAAVSLEKPERSLLLRAVRGEGRAVMPPTGHLPAAEIEALERWVAQGALWPRSRARVTGDARHWAFQPVRRPALPKPRNGAWVKSPVDAFILAELEKKGLRPAPPADRRTLIRRAYVDLIGLPPSPEEVEAFVADRSPEAFGKVVDRLLASPRYGERWGRHWLDLVRYADSRDARGIGGDSDIAEAWRYRDWVVDAFNRDLPYDQFIINQIAGDLLPPSEPGGVNAPGLIATGLLTIGEWGTGDSDKEKMMTDIVDDQVNVVSHAFMGLTVGCARCHDHKFDPISTKDYYALAGIFFSTHIIPAPGPKTAGSPMLRTPLLPPAELARIERRKSRIAELEKELKTRTDAAAARQARALLPDTGKYLLAAWDYAHQPPGSDRRALAEFAQARSLRPYALRQWVDLLGLSDYRLMTTAVDRAQGMSGVHGWRGAPDCPNALVNTNDREVSILTFKLPPKSVALHPGPTSGAAVRWTSPFSGELRISGKVADADPVCGDGIAWAVEHRTSGGAARLASGEIPNSGSAGFGGHESLQRVAVRVGDELDLLILPKNGHACDTTSVTLTLTPVDGKTTAWDLATDVVAAPSTSTARNPQADRRGNPDVWSFLDMGDSGPGDRSAVLAALNPWTRTAAAVAEGKAERGALERAAAEAAAAFSLADARSPFWPRDPGDLSAADREALSGLRTELDGLKEEPEPEVAYALAAREGGVPGSKYEGIKDARVHIRGSYQRLGDTVPRGFPVVLAGANQPPITEGSGRLQLARWLARPGHPLTGRVLVNRVWQYHFGEGLVRTPNNFGKLGERPTHPELLDWLAHWFSASNGGWSIKRLHRLIMLSSAYQQSSVGDPRTEKADPDNRLWGRANRKRMEAEVIRDSLLAVAGRLDTTMGGMATRDFNSPRRTLYQMTIRSDRSGFRTLFDAADAETSVARRTVSTVAPQALFLLNHPFAQAQAEGLAARVLKEATADADRVRRAYLLLYARPPSADELGIGTQFIRSAGAAPEVAWREYCHVLLCSNEFIYVD